MSQYRTSEIKAAEVDRIGFFGKLPTHGDFVATGIGQVLQRELDDWLQSGLRAGEERLGSGWRAVFHAMPPWRFIVEKGLWGPATVAGILLPSTDRVGRSFPLVIAAQLHSFDDHPRQLYLDAAWFTAAEALAETSFARDFDIATFIASLKRLRLPHAEKSPIAGWFSAQRREGSTLWWKAEAIDRDVKAFRTASAPTTMDFLRLIDGVRASKAAEAQSRDDAEPAAALASPRATGTEAPAAVPPVWGTEPARPLSDIAHSHATHPGTRLSLNADALVLSDAAGLFALADGIGDDVAAVEAARLTAATLAEANRHDAIEDNAQEIKGKLGRAHGLLQSIGHSGQRQTPAASVVVLSVRNDAFAVVWAGDARCYLLRDGLMRCLTRDHVEIGMKRRLTRHLGAERQLVPETHVGRLASGDRFLLCSGSLPRVLSERAIAEVLLDIELGRAASVLVQDGLIANSRDNLSAIVVEASLA
ncbi:type VI secretion system-associated protein TagF [Sinorhizobium saheli]|uniref:Nitrogen fixation protein n=1 Tax=Sinorhizobium saheli TaxID=36856 RepID=A0A178Y4L9_SINSA|nr:type VI secretion system-associated protein TagF [Sinorhizobium saheli]MQW89271.1 type VI secretion system-associated protein TagF [Sinorhizobium saheli]OAP41963.1 nitrogen fixation protein [Sinorhizobium saheli]